MSAIGKIVWVALGVGVIGYIVSSGSSNRGPTPEQVIQREKQERLAAQQLAEDQQQAMIFNVPVEAYQAAKNKVSKAGLNCVNLITSYQGLSYSEWETRSWSDGYVDRWYMEGPDKMVVAGSNIRTKNVGIPRIINYKCRVSVDRAESIYSDMRLVTD